MGKIIKISDLIKQLNKFKKEYGDINVTTCLDDTNINLENAVLASPKFRILTQNIKNPEFVCETTVELLNIQLW